MDIDTSTDEDGSFIRWLSLVEPGTYLACEKSVREALKEHFLNMLQTLATNQGIGSLA